MPLGGLTSAHTSHTHINDSTSEVARRPLAQRRWPQTATTSNPSVNGALGEDRTGHSHGRNDRAHQAS